LAFGLLVVTSDMVVLFWGFLALALALALAWTVMAAPAFLDPPPRRRSEGDFMAASNPLVHRDPATSNIGRNYCIAT
jgi:hypothetical protein